MKKKIIIISIIIILIIIYMLSAYINMDFSLKLPSFSEEKYKKINDNLYYSDELISFKEESEKTMLKRYELLSQYLDKNYHKNIFYIENFNIDTLEEDTYIFILYQMIDNAIATDTYVGLDIVSNEVKEFKINNLHNTKELKAKINISKKELRKKAMSLAKKHSKEMDTTRLNINGKYHLEYTKEKGFYYKVILNNGSYIQIDTNGNIIDEYYFNGKQT